MIILENDEETVQRFQRVLIVNNAVQQLRAGEYAQLDTNSSAAEYSQIITDFYHNENVVPIYLLKRADTKQSGEEVVDDRYFQALVQFFLHGIRLTGIDDPELAGRTASELDRATLTKILAFPIPVTQFTGIKSDHMVQVLRTLIKQGKI